MPRRRRLSAVTSAGKKHSFARDFFYLAVQYVILYDLSAIRLKNRNCLIGKKLNECFSKIRHCALFAKFLKIFELAALKFIVNLSILVSS
jgi:hypothetical protein